MAFDMSEAVSGELFDGGVQRIIHVPKPNSTRRGEQPL
jgi:hypothetical protein